jgi:hypothetical protein
MGRGGRGEGVCVCVCVDDSGGVAGSSGSGAQWRGAPFFSAQLLF